MGSIRNVLVVGAGITGLTLASALRQKQISVDVIDIKSDPGAIVGVGLTLMGNALAALDRIGVARSCIENGMPANDYQHCGPDGVLQSKMPDSMLAGLGFPGHVSMTRYGLYQILADAALKAGARIKAGLTFTEIADRGVKVDVTFTDGTEGSYDLVVGADGVYSKVRQFLFPEIELAYCGQAVWRVEVPRPKDVLTTILHLHGDHGAVGICPVSHDKAYLYLVESALGNPWLDENKLLEILRDKLRNYSGRVPGLLATIRSSKDINYRPLEWFLAPAPWYKGRVIIIGDAAHANPPVLGQGAAMGIEDALVLSEEISAESSIEAALHSFMNRRFKRVQTIVMNSVNLAKWEVEHTPNVDRPSVWRQTDQVLSQPM